METESTDWTEFAPIPEDLPELDTETVAAVRGLQGGEIEESTQHLFTTFEPRLAAYFRRNSCQDHEAEDLVQIVFIRLAIVLVAAGRRDEARHQVVLGRSLLRTYLGRN